jgi:hypothetical protein
MKKNPKLDKIIKQLQKQFKHGHPDFIDMTMDELDLHDRKNNDYAGSDDNGNSPLGNFIRVASILSNYPDLKLSDPTVVAVVYALKQLDAALWLMNTGREGQVESIDDRLKDIHVYVKLARILYKESHAIKSK